MSGFGFSDLARHLNQMNLKNLKGKNKKRSETDYSDDKRESKDNKTNYNELVNYQVEKESRSNNIRKFIFSILIIGVILIVVSLFRG